MFELKGNLTKEDYFEKTKGIRKMPRHLKYTLFNEDKIKDLRKHKDFFLVFFISEDIKKTANKLMKKKLYREAIKYYSQVKYLFLSI